ncbi:MMPL family transporter [Streptomyces sp. SID4919]|uniref:MMPL family transporter n=1 Tax=unclassified Streptomyces TaxID=2593676 RepID=UPI000823E022|nr:MULTISPECIES: MMPL family transporter [unclassified Streptomyces]MYY13887.1 MMPL family transporter [Streptomyces sp. SID4919]SCK31249.1 putative drug exporter of the RND superfamily [Streptomyces sp. AmelKG-E11A]
MSEPVPAGTRRPPRRRPPRLLVPLLLLAVWIGVGGVLGPFAGRLGEVATNDQSAFLPRSAESTKVGAEQRDLAQEEPVPAIVVWTAEDGGRLDAGTEEAANRVLAAVGADTEVIGRVPPVVPSEDGEALRGVVPLDPALGDALPTAVEDIGAAAGKVPGTTAQVAGPAASQADLKGAFSGIDGLLLVVALATVLVILVLVYRSVLLPLVIILSAVLALALSCAVVYALADAGVVRVDGQVQGILSILVIGAATDYALLLTARHREELAVRSDAYAALRAAVRRSAGAILASAATVAFGLLALLLSDLTNNRALGPVGAIGIAGSVLAVLTFLPAVLMLLGRSVYWPAKPETTTPAPTPTPVPASAPTPATADGTGEGPRAAGAPGTADGGPGAAGVLATPGVWGRVARLVDRAPRRVWATSLAVLALFSVFAGGLSAKGLPLDEIFVNDAPSVAAQETLGRHFPGGSGTPAVILTDADTAEWVVRAAADTEGVASAAPAPGPGGPGSAAPAADGRVRIDAVLADSSDSAAAERTVLALRDTVHAVAGADALVGGWTAQRLDARTTAEHDRDLIVPVVLLIVLVILIGLLRALVLPLLLVATVALSFLATLGVSALVFPLVLGSASTDPSVPLYGFVFLVALGVDYNIFLMSRAREESLVHGVRTGMLRGLVTTGGVITSAGVVLAATFAALAVIPLSFLVQIAFIVAFGVLLDTLIVRSLLVPALVRDLGPRAWWPGVLSRQTERDPGAARPATGKGEPSGG